MFHTPNFLTIGTTILGNSDFQFQVDTTKAGSASDTFILPLSSGTTNFTIDWGDGNTDLITAYNQAELTHVYSSSGTYNISVDGIFNGVYFNNSGDKLKIISIDNWGANEWYSLTSSFFGCANMTSTYTDALKFKNSGTDANGGFRACTLFNGTVNDWDWSKIDRVDYMFLSCNAFNQPMNLIDTSNVVFWTYFLGYCPSFNQDISNFDFSSTSSLSSFLESCTSFNQSLAAWDISGITSMGNVLKNTGLSTANYDATLIGWEAGTHNNSITLNATGLTYTLGGAAETARTTLVGTDLWTITDAGGV